MINGHGDDSHLFGRKGLLDFSSNIPYRNHSDAIIAHIGEVLPRIKNYPDPNASKLTSLLARRQRQKECSIVVTNGSTEAFYITAQAYKGAKSMVAIPSFAEYEDACSRFGHRISYLTYQEITAKEVKPYDMLWMAYPNNPDGYIIPTDTLTDILEQCPDTLVVVDTAYSELSHTPIRIDTLHSCYSNLITIHSLTKTFAIPGLRLGYIVASEQIAERISAMRMPWSVNALAQEAGCYIMEHYEELLPSSGELIAECQLFRDELLNEVEHLEVFPSSSNFFLAQLPKGDAKSLKSYLIEQHGILIRNADNFRGLSPQHFRVSVQGPEANRKLLEALQDYLSQTPI
ncbi:hypothetical protein HQ39_00130 [Porphyromonas sp. COT-108 OH2963]|uniref:pyridoxal phosphate-dependent aminotransferase n=1 Tax=Porphyromonas sp. COT-108 OH2963 TaxID=1515614 RepID=UPI00052C0707|nr:aminotransferase class I/II-fold pyridoxal phosphate-dependent enzyme [Porphyromonas sp. COT-108 OH2963]KGN96517.1 hypothetical protein HQ39_00130 [Porphyromonas sp. COT-108 OH2963]